MSVLQLCLFWDLSSCFMGSVFGTLGKPPASRTFFSSRPAYLPLKQPTSSEPENISLRALLESHCPSVLSPFRSAWWLFKWVDAAFVLLASGTNALWWSPTDCIFCFRQFFCGRSG